MNNRAPLALALTVAAVALLAPVAHAQQLEDTSNLLRLINGARANAGLPSLASDGSLVQAAQRHVLDLKNRPSPLNSATAHTGSDGTNPTQRILQAGFQPGPGTPSPSENVGDSWGTGGFIWSDQDMMNWWMNSPGHRANILNRAWTHVGAARFTLQRDGKTMRYWVTTFGGKTPAGNTNTAPQTEDTSNLLRLVNGARANAGLASLAVDGSLNAVAQRHVLNLAQDQPSSISGYANNLGHSSGTGGFIWSDQDMMNWWMNNASTRANIVSPNWNQIGLGRVTVQKGNQTLRYWCLTFGRR